jgi:hypothetical protein
MHGTGSICDREFAHSHVLHPARIHGGGASVGNDLQACDLALQQRLHRRELFEVPFDLCLDNIVDSSVLNFNIEHKRSSPFSGQAIFATKCQRSLISTIRSRGLD